MVEKSGMITKTKNCHNNNKIAMRVSFGLNLWWLGGMLLAVTTLIMGMIGYLRFMCILPKYTVD